MKLGNPSLMRLGALLGSAVIRRWMGTLQYKIAYYDRACDPASPRCRGQKIYIFWHEYIPFPLYLRGHCNLAVLLSRHPDAEILSHAAYYLGYDVVRGSTNRGGVAALRRLLQKSRQMHLVLTPDGPRGPRRRLAPGSVYLASKLEMPLVVMGFGYDRPRRTQSWDRFAVPRPWSRARAVISSEVTVPPNLDRAGLEYFRQQIERLLNRLTCEAEAWAEAGTRKVNEMPLRREPLPVHCRRHRASPFLPSVGDVSSLTEWAGPHWPRQPEPPKIPDPIRPPGTARSA